MSQIPSVEVGRLRQDAGTKATTQRDIQAKLAAEGEKITRLNAQLEALAYAAATGEAGADEKYAQCETQIAAAEDQIRKLKRAEVQAVQKSQEAADALRTAELAAKIGRVDIKLIKMSEKAAEITTHLQGLSICFDQLLTLANDARIGFVGRAPAFPAALLLDQHLRDAVAVEIWRLHDGRRTPELPGAVEGSHVLVDHGINATDGKTRQQQCPTLVERMAAARTMCLEFMTGKRREGGFGLPPEPSTTPPKPAATTPTVLAENAAPEAKPADGLDDLFPAQATSSPDDGSDGPMSTAEYLAYVKGEEAKLAAQPKVSAAEIQASFPKRRIAI